LNYNGQTVIDDVDWYLRCLSR